MIEINVLDALSSTIDTKNKIKHLKKNYLNVSARFLLVKQKQKNINNLKRIAMEKLLNWKTILDDFDNCLSSNQMHESYVKLCKMTEDMKKSSHLKSLQIYCYLMQSGREKMKALFLHADKIFGKLFLARNENYKELFIFNISICNLDEYLNVNYNYNVRNSFIFSKIQF